MKKIISMCILCVLCLLLISCSNDATLKESKAVQKNNKGHESDGKDFSVWVTYWDLDNFEQEISSYKNNIDNICFFAAYFNADEKLFVPQEITQAFGIIKSKYKKYKYHSYLTFVNDLLKTDGTSSLKDTKLLYTLFSSEERMNDHINEIINMTVSGGYDGIEIDYEGIHSDISLWRLYLNFIKKLYKAAAVKKIPVRIVLEPNVPNDKLKFIKGPEYVMMCYNLYGDGTKPGPKANQEFLKQMVEKMKSFPGKVNFALSSGGFDFASDGTTKQITEINAVALKNEYNADIRRDSESNCIIFNYTDSQGMLHEVWYADKETLNFWYNTINKYGNYGFSLWRIGGNVTDNIQ